MTETEPNYKKLYEDILVELDKKQIEFKNLLQKYESVQNQQSELQKRLDKMPPQPIETQRFSQEPKLQEQKMRQKPLINSNEDQIQEIHKKSNIQNSNSSQSQKRTQSIHQSSFNSYSVCLSNITKLQNQRQTQQHLSMRGISQTSHKNSDQQKKAEKSKISSSGFPVKQIFTDKIINALGIIIWRFKNFKKLEGSSSQKIQHHFKWETGFFIKKNQIITTASFFILQGVPISPQNYQILFFPYVLSNQPQQKRYLKVKSFHIHSEFEDTQTAPIEKRYHDFAAVNLEQDDRITSQQYLSINNLENAKIDKNDQIAIIGYIENPPSSKSQKQAKFISHLDVQLNFPQINHVISIILTIIKAQVQSTQDFGVQFKLIQPVTENKRTQFTEQKCNGLGGSPIFIFKKDSEGEIIVAGVYKGIHGNNKSASLLRTQSLQNFLYNQN